ncbi:hypothetical protein GC173_10440 [bacterium]|nr:hypothetical protein [bacterium]
MFPAVDPIPLPAPVWLFKVLHIVTLALHFAAMQLLVGGLLLATLWAALGRMRRDPVQLSASGAVVTRLPVVMTYVINFGVPPLLFAQVLYGRAIYTSSVLMGVYWISVIFILIAAYWLLYVVAKRAEMGKAWAWIGLVSALLILKVAAIYVSNMTLMIRPDVWQEMYRSNPGGTQMHSGDPTVWPRFFFMMVGALAVAGVGLMTLGLKKSLASGVGDYLARNGGLVLAGAALAQAGLAFWVMGRQPEGVATDLAANSIWRVGEFAWLGTAALMVACGVFAAVAPAGRRLIPVVVAGLVAFLNIASMTLVRDGIRDVTLLQHGFDVWDRTVVTNWSVVSIFLFLFVVMLGVIGWLISVVARAKQEVESYA